MNGDFIEADEGEVILADEDPAIFTRFNEWLYTGVFFLDNETEKDILYKVLIDLYIFAEKRGVIRLQNAVIDGIIKKNSLPTIDIRHAWSNTSDSSPLHMLLVELYVRKAKFAEIMDEDKKRKLFDSLFDKDILVAYVLAFHRLKDNGSILASYDFWKERCHYHVHNDRFPPCGPHSVTGQPSRIHRSN